MGNSLLAVRDINHKYIVVERIMVYGMKPGDKYYDGPVENSGRTIEEIERDIEKEKERIKDIKWSPDMLEE